MMTGFGPFSVYKPKKIFTGRSWDAQSVCLLLHRSTPRSILLLGLGGGTVARQCRALFPDATICAVEMDARIIEIARRDFGIASCDIHVIRDSAEQFLRTSRRSFDAIVDDAWPVSVGESRSAWHDDGWPQRWRCRLNPGGLFAVNLFARRESPVDHKRMRALLRRSFPQVFEVEAPGRLAAVLAAGDGLRSGQQTAWILRGALVPRFPELSALRFRSC